MKQIDNQYRRELTYQGLDQARKQDWKPDLIVWPETVFCRAQLVAGDGNAEAPPDFPYPSQTFPDWLDKANKQSCDVLTDAAREFGKPMIVGLDRQYFSAQGRETLNSAVLITPDGKWCEPDRLEQSYYDKMHLVPFGEYMPFAKTLPWLQSPSPLGSRLQSGRAA